MNTGVKDGNTMSGTYGKAAEISVSGLFPDTSTHNGNEAIPVINEVLKGVVSGGKCAMGIVSLATGVPFAIGHLKGCVDLTIQLGTLIWKAASRTSISRVPT